ncbi:transglutaminase domain-containing protein [Methanobrevibacter sp. DSM 116169]|uniref:transglutaminase domain-containing protein n=1 Tax=Methanobrevibacter sp. DSM 116169 TaxID=3242727 RepID=UPI0038FBF613
MSVAFLIFISMGACVANDSINVDFDENQNLIQDDNVLSSYENLGFSDDSIITTYQSNGENISEYDSSIDGGNDYYNEDDIKFSTNNQISSSNLENAYIDEEISFNNNDVFNSKKDTIINADNVTKIYKNDTHYVVELKDLEGNLLDGMDIIFSINGESYTRTTVNGIAMLSINLSPGHYSASATFNGNENYSSFTIFNDIDVLPSVVGHNIEKIYKNGTQYYATIYGYDGSVLADTVVSMNINGVIYERKTNSDGVVMLSINLDPGKYVITVTHPDSFLTVSNNVTVLPSVVGYNIEKIYKNGTQYYATIYGYDGSVLADTVVSMNINGVIYERKTNSDGVVMLSINLDPGKYVITVTHPDSFLTVSNNVTVLPSIVGSNIIKSYRNGTQYYATIYGYDGSVLADTVVSMNINGVIYERKTNSDGVVMLSINLDPGEYVITVTHPNSGLMTSNIVKVIAMETVVNGSDYTITSNAVQNYTVTYTDINGNPISDLPVYFKINGETYYLSTDKNGIASIILNLGFGKHSIDYGFEGSSGYIKSSGSSTITILNSTTILTGSDLTTTYNDGSYYSVKLTDYNGNPLIGKNIIFVINGQSYSRTTDENGIAKIAINLDPGKYSITYYYSNESSEDYNKGQNTITVNKISLDMSASDLTMEWNDGSTFEVLLTQNGKPVANKNIIFTINGNTYSRTTNALGIASLSINLNAGIYTVHYKLDDDLFYSSNGGQNTILVNGTFLKGSTGSFAIGDNYNVILKDVYGKPISGETIKFIINNQEFTRLTNNEGIASIVLNYNPGEYTISYYLVNSIYGEISGQEIITILNLIEINSIISAANVVKNHIENNYNLPSHVTIEGKDYSMAQFLYLLTVATNNLNEGNLDKIAVRSVNDPSNPLESSNLGNLYMADYLFIASFISNYIIANGEAPNSADSSLGSITFEGLIYAYARIVVFYGNNANSMPAYVSIKSVGIPVSNSVLNSINTITDLDPYLSASKNCQVDNAVIQALAAQLTEGLTNDLAKANAIFEFCRYEIDYWFYYDTKYGAVGTLNAGGGNCVDGTHLFIALSRAAGLPARYVHGTCTWTISGSTYGHVWAQVLIGDTWVVADTSSTRNSFGEVVSWNNYNYVFKGFYASLQF